MQIESLDQKSFVDLLDGYTYLPVIPDKYLRPDQAILHPEYLSQVLHEFTHQLAMTNVFGAVSACLNSMAIGGQHMANYEALCYYLPLVDIRDEKYLDAAVQSETINLFLAHYARPLENYYLLVAGSRWLLEGIALFAEHDFHLSKEYNAASKHFEFLLSMLHSQPGGKSITTEDVDDFLNKSHDSDPSKLNKWLLMSNSEISTLPYFAGYIIIKGMQYILSLIDKRLADPEIFLIFISGYFFNDFRLLALCDIQSGSAFSQALKMHYTKAIEEIVHIESSLLESAVDRIVKYQQFPTGDFNHTDFSAILGCRDSGLNLQDVIDKNVLDSVNKYLPKVSAFTVQVINFS